MATRGHLVVPTSKAEANEVIEQVRDQLTYVFGGVSMYEGSGAWDSDGEPVTESHARFVVTGEDDGQVRYEICEEARYVKDALDEEAVLVEFEECEMELI